MDCLCLPELAPCGDSARLWLRGQYLLWWTKGNPMPVLASTSPPDTPWDQAGVPGTAGYEVLFGDRGIANEARGGGWLTLGYWLDDCHTLGLQVDWFLVGNDKGTGAYAAESDGTWILARPFYDDAVGQWEARKLAFPGVVSGAIDIGSSSELNSGGALLRKNWRGGSRGRIDLLGGYRHFCYREDLTIADRLTLLAPVDGALTGTKLTSFDSFATENDFDGGEFGVAAEFRRGSWSLNLSGKVALGRLRQQLHIDGSTKIVVPEDGSDGVQTLVYEGGLFTEPADVGRYSRCRLAVLPEVDLNLEYHLTERFSLIFGYTVIGLNRVLRTGDQIDIAVGQPNSPVLLREAGFWAQGISVGAQLAR
jgi:hypothetical protein